MMEPVCESVNEVVEPVCDAIDKMMEPVCVTKDGIVKLFLNFLAIVFIYLFIFYRVLGRMILFSGWNQLQTLTP